MSKHLAATAWSNNSQLIGACFDLQYLREDSRVIDATFGKGNWWIGQRPKELVTHDIRIDGVDFRKLPYEDDSFDDGVFDPPYMAKGGRSTSGIGEMDDRYGLGDAPATPALLQELINEGLTEYARVVKPKGFILVKCMDYVSSGTMFPGVLHTLNHGISLGLTYHDRSLHYRTAHGLQPKRSRKDGEDVRQHHFGSNYSTLIIFRQPRVKR